MDEIELPKKCIQIESSVSTSYYLLEDGTVWGQGKNDSGQLGVTSPSQILQPQQIPELQNIICISCSLEYVLFLDSQGNIYGCGSNNMQILGIFPPTSFGIVRPGTSKNITSVKKITGISNIVYIKATAITSYFIDKFGKIYVFGRNPIDKLPITKITILPLTGILQVYDFYSIKFYIANTGDVYVTGIFQGKEYKVPTIIPFLFGVQYIQRYQDNIIFIRFDGKVFDLVSLDNQEEITQVTNIKKIIALSNAAYIILTGDENLYLQNSINDIKLISENISDFQIINVERQAITSVIMNMYISILDNQGKVFQFEI